MTNAPATTAALSDYLVRAIADGYVFECSCGELHNTFNSAKHCRKCRVYTKWETCTRVVNVETGETLYDMDAQYERWEQERIQREAAEQAARDEQARQAAAPFTMLDACPALATILETR